ncbi:UDP-glucoronosyl and UDP-glucosyl transferase [Caballeronia udeis]|uniref:UDP-glucoronosyl and UDP-glucosyl transferase n=1 Tax=Caballeronia udeis TaxID=1232866 RepID=A0A158JCR5_9BURK|nr:nucleotide disphospho-sugar-binding domain-containing protein [Caballeronia udeis]SAL66658.1 UDP-glucoronosyl and UDP-glucosyl transferase [Caballeronia udeis]
MTQIIITAIGSAGDVHPFIGIARTLAQRGHRIVFCTHPQFAELAEDNGFVFVPIGTWDEYASAMLNPALWDPRTSFKTLWNLIAPSIRPHFNTLAALTTPDTVLVGSLWAFAARLMQEVHGTPYVSVQVSPSTLLSASAPPTHKRLTVPIWLPRAVRAKCLALIETSVLDKACGPALNDVRATLGLPPASRILGQWLHSPDGVLCLFPDWFAPPQPDWPRNHLMAGFPLFNDVSTAAIDDELKAFIASGARPVVFTPGSTQIDQRAYFDAVDEAVRRTGVRAIVLSRGARARWTEDSNLTARDFVPMSTLLQHCAAIVHHGGIGTAALAFAAGIPQVVTPFAHDQFDNAQRVAKSGCGLRIDGPASGRALAAAIKRVTTDPLVARYCAHVRWLLDRSPDACEMAARYIEDVAWLGAQRAA